MKTVYYHGTSAYNLESILKYGLSTGEGKIWSCSEDAVYLEGDELDQAYTDRVPEINHYIEGEGNTICYPMLIVGDRNSCEVQVIDEQCNIINIDLFELDAHNLTVLADFIEANY